MPPKMKRSQPKQGLPKRSFSAQGVNTPPVSKQELLRRNMDFIKTTFPDFFRNLTSPAFYDPDVKVSGSDTEGNLTVSHGGVSCSLHSRYSIDREMEMLFKPLTDDDNQVVIIFGLGYGHCVDYIRRKRIKYKRLVIFEPCTNILTEVLMRRGVMELLGMKELYLHLLKTPNDMAQYLLDEALESKTVKMLYHMSYRSLFKDTYDNVLRSFRNVRIANEASINTMRLRAKEWNINQLKSIRGAARSASALSGGFKKVPGIIASAGPSLEKHFELLREIGDRALIVAPGSSIRILNAHDINAHIAAVIDSSNVEASFFRDYRQKNVLIGSYRMHPDVYGVFPGPVFRGVLSTEFVALYYYEWLKERPFYINDHPSVSAASIDLLYLMGCDPIILIGQDLCYQDNRSYAGSGANSLSEWERNGTIPDVDIHGNRVSTNFGYKAMQNDFELTNIKYRGQVTILNATEGGLDIHGIENVKFADVYEYYIARRGNDVAERIAAAEAATVAAATGAEAAVAATGAEAGAMTDAGDRGEQTVTEFYRHLLTACDDTEKLLNEKEARFDQLTKLIKRGVSKNRLNAEVGIIKEYDKKLAELPFFKTVVFPNIDSSLVYYRASGKHIADSGDDWEGTALYESKFDEFAFEFINLLKALVLSEMVSDLVKTAT